jgi:hypothetical protein
MERMQKRDFFRLEVQFELSLAIVAAASDPESEPQESVSGTVVDISGGGFGLFAKRPVDVGTQLQIPSDFSHFFPIAGLRCQVSECRRQSQGYMLGSEIVRKIYQQQIDRVVA